MVHNTVTFDKYKVDVPEGVEGSWSIRKFTVTDNPLWSIDGRHVPVGRYTGLYRGNTIVMTDTPDEIRDHRLFMCRASGDVLIAGLGLGMVLQGCASKDTVKSVTVIEQSPEVIKLVAAYYKAKVFGHKVTIVNADIFEWKPAKGSYFNCAWYDIWNDLCTDNLDEMTKLHRKFARRVGHQDSWGKEFLKARRRQERRWEWKHV
jgi:hypothetical protein